MKTERKKHPEILQVALNSIKGKVLKVGWVQNKKYPNSDMTTAGVAAIAERGSEKAKIPPRPIMMPTNNERKSYWRRVSTVEMHRIMQGKQTGEGQLNILGNIIAGHYRKKITEIFSPPLKSSTVKARLRYKNKGLKNKIKYVTATFEKPLVFTKQLLNSCTYAVEDE